MTSRSQKLSADFTSFYCGFPIKLCMLNQNRRRHFFLIATYAAIAFLFLSACRTSFAEGDLGIVVERVAPEKTDIHACKYCGKLMNPGIIHSEAENIVNSKLRQSLTERGIGFKDGRGNQSHITVLIYRFQERKGGNFAVDKPAGVGLHMHVMQGNIVGRTFVFDEDQQSLSQNVLGIGKFFRRGGKWISVEEMAEEAINKGTDYLLEVLQ